MKIGVIGCGNMGAALIRGMLKSRFIAGSRMIAWDPDRTKLKAMARSCGLQAARSNAEVAAAHVVLLAVKPQQMDQVLREIRPHVAHRPLIISIAAGISTRWIERRIGRSIPVIRVMPNTPALVGAGISAVAGGRHATQSMLKITEQIFHGVGEVVRVPEKWINAVTAVSGSGPAYFFFLMEQMIQTGVRLGLSREAAHRLVVETAEGAAILAKTVGADPKVLRAKVTSKGGTTEAAFKVFTRRQLGKILQQGIRAAAKRAKELGG